MIDQLRIRLPSAENTRSAGESLALSLYGMPVTLWLTGELGAGKTTFLRGFASGLGISERITSPTFALEQRYQTDRFGELLHLDVYRLSEHEASDLIHSSDDHPHIRCIEWAERYPEHEQLNGIHLHFDDRGAEGRDCTIAFRDEDIPNDQHIAQWRARFAPPSIVIRHCEAVASAALRAGQHLVERGVIVRLNALQRAGQLHDLLRFLDFSKGAGHMIEEINETHARIWEETARRYEGQRHEAACAQFLREEGFPMMADIVAVHGLSLASSHRSTIEQQLLYYADKRVKLDEVVSLEERLRDFSERYGKGSAPHQSTAWYEEARETERMLFPDGAPF